MNISEILQPLDDLTSSGGVCNWSDVANARDEARRRFEAALSAEEPLGVRCTGCGSSWDNERLAKERAKRPELISCCPERKMITVYAVPSMPHEASHD